MFKMVMGLANKDSKRINTNSFEIVLESLIDENRSCVTIDVHIYLRTPHRFRYYLMWYQPSLP